MYITRIFASNFRCFETLNIEPSRSINLLVGGNNSGKSTILRTITTPQFGPGYTTLDSRSPESPPRVLLELDGKVVITLQASSHVGRAVVDFQSGQWEVECGGTHYRGVSLPIFFSSFPTAAICVFLAKRKVAGYSEQVVSSEAANKVQPNLENLFAKLDAVLADGSPIREAFISATVAMLGLQIGVAPSIQGRSAGYSIDVDRRIEIAAMGEGVAQILGLTADLLRAREAVFVIEELENDLHPRAIRSLLNIVLQSARERGNQFFISTHSNVVLRHLAAEEQTKVFRTSFRIQDGFPTSDVEEVPNTYEARRELLEELGYELFDAGLHAGYLILEESSAETVINEVLIPKFVPALQRRLCTVAANGYDEAAARFQNFARLFIFLHREPAYLNRAWVVFDAGDKESKELDRLKGAFVGPEKWSNDTFVQWTVHDFERFYPKRFSADVDTALSFRDKREKDAAKKALRAKVLDWVRNEPLIATQEFEDSAQEVITFLRQIETKLRSVGALS